VSLVKERMKKLSDYCLLRNSFSRIRNHTISTCPIQAGLQSIRTELAGIGEWNAVSIGERMAELAKKLGMKNSEFFMVLRVAVTGKKITPP
jgi:glutamyl/glutaminyl-tRNA synthetase